MSTSFNRTRTQIATKVMSKVTQLGVGTVTTADADLVYEAIDLRLKEMHKLGVYWRKVNKTPLSFTIPPNVTSASASADVLFPISMTVVDSSVDTEVEIIGIMEYAAIENKAKTGTPTKALWNGSAEFIFYPVPTSSTTVKLTYQKITDGSSAGAIIDVDQSMLKSFIDIIAYDVGDDFGVDERKMQRWEVAARRAEINIRALGSQKVALSAVKVENYDSPTETDYNQ